MELCKNRLGQAKLAALVFPETGSLFENGRQVRLIGSKLLVQTAGLVR